MTTTAQERREARRFAIERELAPHVDPRWAEGVLLELRIQGVAGDLIGEALGEVDSHCAESGESADEAFGDPVAYARSLGLPRSPDQGAGAVVRTVLPTLVQLAGMFLTLWSVPAVVTGDAVEITVGQVLAGVVLVGALVLLARRPEPVLRALVRRPVVGTVAFGAASAALVVPLLLLRATLVLLPAGATCAVGIALLVVGTAADLVRARRPDGADPVLAPLQDAATTTRRRRESRRVGLFAALLVPAWTLVVGVLLGWLAT
ncbi:hypothetical protein [Cellulosimicrobium sp. CUA-896]|uniref:hypothetical protein n=1 Tax=Cellulosimicrobium sp. CUA-896 TaxID=1517881 RepID=UPI000961AC85|nr:hypothetical protein [Cellulosimicrobium sp. CUA-896]OLT48106.1 hypothetical protein BJF88_03925 [Cellulosimicrobium sp. CUA-896]